MKSGVLAGQRDVRSASTDVDSLATVLSVHRAARAIRMHTERRVLASVGLSWTSWVVLWVGWVSGELETRQLAYEVGISKPTLTGVLGSLEARGLLRRRTHPDDARRVLVSLTARGVELVNELFPLIHAEDLIATEALSSAEASTLARLLRQLVVSVEGDSP